MNRIWKFIAMQLAGRPQLVDRLIAHCKKHPYFHIYENGDLYMSRYWLIKERAWLPFAIRLHEWHRPDSGRHLHDHPCDYRTIILRGAYVEKDACGKSAVRFAGDTAAFPKEHWHTVVWISRTIPTYSLFIYWGKHQMWGFQVDDKKVPWNEYVNGSSYPAEYHQKRG
jgi:hypothetical protein